MRKYMCISPQDFKELSVEGKLAILYDELMNTNDILREHFSLLNDITKSVDWLEENIDK